MLQKRNGDFYNVAYRIDVGETPGVFLTDKYLSSRRHALTYASAYVKRIGGDGAWANVTKVDYVNNRETYVGGYMSKDGRAVYVHAA